MKKGKIIQDNNKDIIKSIFNRSEKTGYITQEEISYYLENNLIEIDDLDKVFDYANENNIKLETNSFYEENEEFDKEDNFYCELELLKDNFTAYQEKNDYKDNNFFNIYLNELSEIPTLSNEEIIKLAKEYKEKKSIELRNKLIIYNLRLVINVAKQYKSNKISFLDLVEEGNIGLIKAVEKFNPDKGYNFSTYAVWWIRQAIIRGFANQCNLIRIPIYIMNLMQKIEKIKKKYLHENNITISNEELAEILNLDKNHVAILSSINDNYISLDSTISNQENSLTGYDTIPDEDDDFKQYLDKKQLQEVLINFINKLSKKEKDIILLRYGFISGYRYTLDEVGKIVNLTRERVRQLERRGIVKLKKLICKKDIL